MGRKLNREKLFVKNNKRNKSLLKKSASADLKWRSEFVSVGVGFAVAQTHCVLMLLEPAVLFYGAVCKIRQENLMQTVICSRTPAPEP